MTTPTSSMFPDNATPVIGSLTSPGTLTTQIFEFREAVVRSLAAFGFISVTRSTTQPASPTAWDIWIKPGSLSGSTLSNADIKIFDGSAWQDITPALFAQAIVEKGGGAGASASAAKTVLGNSTSGLAVPTDVDMPTLAAMLAADSSAVSTLASSIGTPIDGTSVGSYCMAYVQRATYDSGTDYSTAMPATISSSHATYGLPTTGTWTKRGVDFLTLGIGSTVSDVFRVHMTRTALYQRTA